MNELCRAPQRRSERYEVRSDDGAGRGTRTHDLLITNQLLYQLSYTSTPYQRRLFYQRPHRLSRFFFVSRRKIFFPRETYRIFYESL